MQRLRKITLVSFLALFLAVVLLFGCTVRKEPVPSQPALKVGSDTTYPPFEFLENERPVGFDMDIAREIARRLKLRLEVVPTDFENLFPDLKAGKIDMAMSALVITKERVEEVDFSDPYISGGQAIITFEGSDIKKAEDLANKVVGVEIDTSGELVAKEVPGIKRLKGYRNSEEALRDLKSREIDAIIHDYLIFSHLLKDEPRLEIAARIGAAEDYAAAFQKGSRLKVRVDKVVAEMKKDGTHERIVKKWFSEQE